MQSRISVAALLVVCVLALTSCATDNSNDATEQFANCTNGVLDHGEECDDGNRADNDGCLSSCLVATCGDEFVYAGVEECDGRNLNPTGLDFNSPFTCANLGHAPGTLSCSADCRFDVSNCGPVLTPTPTVPPPATQTPTATATATPDRGMCGNQIVETGETCDDGNLDENDACPSDCTILPCTSSATMLSVQVNFAAPQFQDASSITVLITYPDGTVSIPGTGGDSSVGARVTGRQTGSTVTPNDLDHALRVVYSRAGRINPGRLFLLAFDECSGADVPEIDELGCQIVGCSNSSGPLDGCSCSVEEP